MCLSTVYELGTDGSQRMLAEYVRDLRVTGDAVTLTDIMGKEIRVSSSLQRIDLVKNTILIAGLREKTGKPEHPVKKYEMVREIFNSCSNNQMRDVFITEIETDDVDQPVQEFLTGTEVHYEKQDNRHGVVIFDINTDGLMQRITFTELD
ncbi:MAG: CooT family nickel-binding protein [Treponema sp.]|jgi:predicted RNA-binding protein|nr:CooT family nickel-binding protein [Treponema sp.]